MTIESRILRVKFTKDKITFIKSDTSSAPATLDPDGIRLELTVGRIFHKALNKTRVEGIFEKNDFEFFGKHILYKLLCLFDQQDAKDFVYNELSLILRDDESRGVIVLEFDKAASELALLPWEYLQVEEYPYKRIEPFFIGAQRDLKFDLIRFIPYKPDSSVDYSPVNQKKLIVVNVICNPIKDSLNKVDFLESFEILKREFQDENEDQVLQTWRIENPSKETFVGEMKRLDAQIDGEYILHFYGHARMNKENPEIAFIGKNGDKQWVKSEIFENFFGKNQKYQQPVIVVIQACESGQLNSKGKGLATSLISKGIPFVLAMQNEVTPDTSIAFFTKFYRSLLIGEDFFKAVTIGRVFLGCEYNNILDIDLNHFSNNSFGTPVIFSSTVTSMRFFPKIEKGEKEEDQPKLVCQNCGTKYDHDCGWRTCINGNCTGELKTEKVTAKGTSALSSEIEGSKTGNPQILDRR